MADDINNDESGVTAAPDTGGTNPQAAQPSSPQLDPKAAADNGTPPDGPAIAAANNPFPGTNGAQNGTPSAQDDPQATSATPQGLPPTQATPTPPAVQQQVDKATWTHQVFQALAGGPQTSTTIDPNTGKVERTQVPVSNARLGMAVALAALTGAFNGLAQKGPGAEGRAAAGGFDEALQQKQEQQKAQDDEAAKTYARQASIAQTNFTMHQTAVRMGQLDYESHKEFVADALPVLNNIKTVGADLASGVREQDLLSKYNITKDAAVPDGVVARTDPTTGKQATDKYGQPLWDNTYTVLDPSKKIALDQNTAQFLADHHVPGYFNIVDGKTVAKDFSGSAQVKAGLVVNGLAQASAIRTTEGQLNAQLAKLPSDVAATDSKIFKANIIDGLQNGTVSPKALQTFAKYASMPFDQAIDQMRKDKVDPETIGQVSSLIPQSAQDALRNQRLDQETKDDAVRKATAKHIEDTASLPDKLREETMKKQIDARFAQTEAYNSEAGRIQAKNKFGEGGGAVTHEMVNNPKLGQIVPDPNEQVVNGVRKGYLGQLQSVDPALAAEVQAVGEGRLVQSKYGLAKGDGQRLAGIVALAYPGYDQGTGEAYGKMRENFTAGAQATMNSNGRTTLLHMAALYDTAGKLAAGVPLTKEHSDFNTESGRAIDEMNSAYTKGVLHKDDRAKLEDNANSVRPALRQEFAKDGLRLLGDKIGEVQTQWRIGKASKAVSDFPLLDQDSIDAYNHVLHGERAIDIYGHVSKVAGQMVDKVSGQKYYVDKDKNPLYPVQDNY